jgi:hypothetical protein
MTVTGIPSDAANSEAFLGMMDSAGRMGEFMDAYDKQIRNGLFFSPEEREKAFRDLVQHHLLPANVK